MEIAEDLVKFKRRGVHHTGQLRQLRAFNQRTRRLVNCYWRRANDRQRAAPNCSTNNTLRERERAVFSERLRSDDCRQALARMMERR